MELEPPKMSLPKKAGAQAAFQVQYSYFLDFKSGGSFGVPADYPVQGMAESSSWDLTVTYGADVGGERCL